MINPKDNREAQTLVVLLEGCRFLLGPGVGQEVRGSPMGSGRRAGRLKGGRSILRLSHEALREFAA